jgi:hypothetical protein
VKIKSSPTKVGEMGNPVNPKQQSKKNKAIFGIGRKVSGKIFSK